MTMQCLEEEAGIRNIVIVKLLAVGFGFSKGKLKKKNRRD